MGLLDSIGGIAGDVAAAGALATGSGTLRVESTVLPFPIDFNPTGTGGASGAATTFLKPKISVLDGNGNVIQSFAPGGDPATSPPYGLLLLGVIGALVLFWYHREKIF